MKRYLVRKENSCTVIFDKDKKVYSFQPLSTANEWISRSDVEVIDYRVPEKRKGMRSSFGAPIMLFFDITSKCQCRCWHCYNASGENAYNELSTEKIIKVITNFAEIGGMELRLSGGEPTQHPDLNLFIDAAGKLALRTVLVSNGMIAEDVLDYLCQSPVTAFYLSLQGDEKIHDEIRGTGSYAWCIRTAEKLVCAEKRVRFAMTFHKKNYHCASRIAAIAAEIGTDVAFNPLRPFGSTSAEMMLSTSEHLELVGNIISMRSTYPRMRIDTPWDFLLCPVGKPETTEYKRIGCGNSGLSIASNGECFTCGQLSMMRDFCVGNVRKEDILSIWSKAQRSCRLATAVIPKKCETCSYLYGSPCFGGCFVTSLMVNGSMKTVDPYCFVDLLRRND